VCVAQKKKNREKNIDDVNKLKVHHFTTNLSILKPILQRFEGIWQWKGG
jgi:hypothetical protein